MRKLVGVAALAVVLSFAFAGPALAAQGSKDFVVLTGTLVVQADDTFEDAVIFDGNATIGGTVTGSVVVFNGDATILGEVGGDVATLNGRVLVGESGTVHGDVHSRLSPRIAGQVDGSVGGANFNVDWEGLRFASRLAIWLATTVSSFLLGLVLVLFAPRAADAVAASAEARTGAAVGWGFLVLFGLPIFAVIAIVTLVGIPFGLGLLLALGLLYWLGYVASSFLLGRRLVKAPASRLGAFAVGWGILRVVALVPILAGLVWVAATVLGLGALAIAARAAGRRDASAPTPSGPPIPPMPPMPA